MSTPISITPKGVLAVALGGDIALTEKAWEALRDFAYSKACKGEHDIPCIVFEGGGKCISVTKQPS